MISIAFLAKVLSVWPFTNVYKIITYDSNGNVSSKDNKDKMSMLTYHFSRNFRLITYIILCYCVYQYTFPSDLKININNITSWCIIIIIRDLFITFLVYDGWDYLLYRSSYSIKMKPLKYNPKYPTNEEKNKLKIVAFKATFISSIYEIIIVKYLSKYCLYQSFFENTYYSLSVLFFLQYFRYGHFYFIHRLIHPWNWTVGGIDIGKYLYINYHKLHHTIVNVSPYSGLYMHPIEVMLYYSAMFLCLMLRLHPIHLLMLKFNATIAAAPSHDGFDSPGGAGYFHYLHHTHVECNYGTALVPFDKLFGSYYDGHGKCPGKKL